ncbi:MAG: holo-ACP synthase [Alphaproteobacteria bacterium]|nr:holo-ACP synthase [Alphaproteobacteria bacterium]
MIIGVGIDIVDIRRIAALLQKFPDRFVDRIFTMSEVDFCRARGDNAAASFAKMFSLKEATIKAVSAVEGIRWHDMEVNHDPNGKPIILISGRMLENLRRKAEQFNVQASVSDEKHYATAYVVIEAL